MGSGQWSNLADLRIWASSSSPDKKIDAGIQARIRKIAHHSWLRFPMHGDFARASGSRTLPDFASATRREGESVGHARRNLSCLALGFSLAFSRVDSALIQSDRPAGRALFFSSLPGGVPRSDFEIKSFSPSSLSINQRELRNKTGSGFSSLDISTNMRIHLSTKDRIVTETLRPVRLLETGTSCGKT